MHRSCAGAAGGGPKETFPGLVTEHCLQVTGNLCLDIDSFPCPVRFCFWSKPLRPSNFRHKRNPPSLAHYKEAIKYSAQTSVFWHIFCRQSEAIWLLQTLSRGNLHKKRYLRHTHTPRPQKIARQIISISIARVSSTGRQTFNNVTNN